MKCILIVEDDVYIGDMLEELLTQNAYRIMRAYSGTEALLQCQINHPDLILLDLMLPGINGEVVLEKVKDQAPVIIMSARSTTADKVQHLLNGAVDYITKPFHNEELLARIYVHVRKPILKDDLELLSCNGLTLFPQEYIAKINNIELKLTKLEFGILHLLMKNPHIVYSRSMIVEKIWDYESLGDEDSVKVHISNLRTKLKEHTEQKYIDTIWGIGFKFHEES